jgi:hypothetical protein
MMMYQVQLDNFTDLDIEPPKNGLQKSIVEHEPVGLNGAILEDTGNKARKFSFVVWFRKKRYSEADQFRSYLADNQIVSFVHPVLGLLKCRVSAVDEANEENESQTSFNITLIEDGVLKSEQLSSIDVVPSVESSFIQGIDEQKNSFINSFSDTLGSQVMQIPILPDQPLIRQFTGLGTKARSLLSNIDKEISALKTMQPGNDSLQTSILSEVNFGSTLPDLVIGTASRAINRIAMTFAAIRDVPYQFAQSFYSACDNFADSLDNLKTVFKVHSASRGALEMAVGYDADERRRDELKQYEQAQAFDYNGRFLRRNTVPQIATVNEIEKGLQIALDALKAAVSISDDPISLIVQSNTLLRFVENVKINRNALKLVTVTQEIPLHILLLQYDLPYTYADRILSINPDIVDPARVCGEVWLYER